jgi:hypothetical protein
VYDDDDGDVVHAVIVVTARDVDFEVTIRSMATWRCPHCGTPQEEAARCWVCRRSSTTCATCRHARSAVVARVAYCGLDPRRTPIAGDEHRGCWSGRPLAPVRSAARPLRVRRADGELVAAGSVDLGLWVDAEA